MVARANVLLLVVSFMLRLVSIKSDDISSSVQVNAAYDELYADGVRLYFKDDWNNSIVKFEAAIEDWKNERKFTLLCREECGESFAAIKQGKLDVHALEYLRYLYYMRNCSQACMKTYMGRRLPVSKHVHRLFENRVPYSFMQFNYHKV